MCYRRTSSSFTFHVVYSRLGMYRDAEKQFKSAIKQQDFVDTYLYLCKVYVRLDQPVTAVDIYKQGLEKFKGERALLTGIARIYEVIYRPFYYEFVNVELINQHIYDNIYFICFRV